MAESISQNKRRQNFSKAKPIQKAFEAEILILNVYWQIAKLEASRALCKLIRALKLCFFARLFDSLISVILINAEASSQEVSNKFAFAILLKECGMGDDDLYTPTTLRRFSVAADFSGN